MKLKATYSAEDFESVDGAFRDLYEERDGHFILTGIEGIKTEQDVAKLSEVVRKERALTANYRKQFDKLGGRDVDEILAELDQIEAYKAAAESKGVDENVIETRLKSKLAPIQREKDQLAKQYAEAQELLGQYQQKERVRTIHDSVRSAIAKSAGFLGQAAEDALMYAERMLEIDETGRVVTKDSVGVTPGIDATVWLQEMQQRKPYWWGESKGGGATGGKSSGGVTGDNPFSHAGWNVTAQAKLVRENPERAAQMARSAGTSIGGPRPQK